MPGGKLIALLAIVAIAGVTGTLGVFVVERAPSDVKPTVAPPTPVRPRLTNSDDARTTELHRAHLTAAKRIDCSDCHELRANEFLRPTVERCTGCHENHRPAVHGASEAAACLTCHDFLLLTGAAGWASSCESCHAQPQGTRPAITSHTEKCTQCHGVHESRTPAACESCHELQTTAHAGKGAAACQSCHPPHTPARLARERCTTCHVEGAAELPASVRIPETALFGGHDRCVQCHDDHAFAKTAVRACRDCHRDRPVAAAHAACTGCHDPHAARDPLTARDCTGCHANKLVLAATKVAAHADCKSCHDPHTPNASAAERCASCHRTVAASSHAQGRSCVTCHPPHTELGAANVACSSCHAERREHASAQCRDCHPRHGVVPAAEPAFCLGCHKQPIASTAAIATSAGHAQCATCHANAAHRASGPRPACATCHAQQAASAPAGHADCKSCHDVHSGKRRPQATRCDGCHADRARTPHVRVPGGCETCHRAHGPGGRAAPPSCKQCHSTPLPGMHVVAKHSTCSDCHRAHDTQVRDRETCLRCHTDRRQHEANATLCQACHTFGGY